MRGSFPKVRRRHAGGPPHVWAKPNALVDCGWGRILFAQTFEDASGLVSAIRAENPEQRDIAMYVSDPHVLLASAPAELASLPMSELSRRRAKIAAELKAAEARWIEASEQLESIAA